MQPMFQGDPLYVGYLNCNSFKKCLNCFRYKKYLVTREMNTAFNLQCLPVNFSVVTSFYYLLTIRRTLVFFIFSSLSINVPVPHITYLKLNNV